MADDPDNQDKNSLAFDPEFQTENIAFDPNEMIDCDGCGRTNPPNRLNCIYCGRELDIRIDAASVKTNLRKLELWERGFNVIVHKCIVEKQNVAKIEALLSMDANDVEMILDAGCPLPLARVENEKEAAIIVNNLTQLNVKCSIVRDDDLAIDKPLVRLSSIDFLDNSFELKDFNTGNVTGIAKIDLALIVPGTITSGKVDSLENKGRGGKSKLIDETTTAADESILDIFTRNDAAGFRVRMAGFDFSGLGKNKGLLATKNLRSLIVLLKEQAPNAKLVNNYSAVRQALGIVWDIESRKDSKGIQRIGFGKKEFAGVATTINLNQFTKYSRLQWHLL